MGYCLYLTFLHSSCFLYYKNVLYNKNKNKKIKKGFDNTVIPPCAVTFTHTLPYIYSYTADKGCTDSAVLYALLRLRGEARALKLEKKASMKRLFRLLMGFGK